MKKLLIFCLLLLCSFKIFALDIALEEATILAENWSSTFNRDYAITDIITKQYDNGSEIYVFNFESGWLMVTSTRNDRPILGFSFESNYRESEEPAFLKEILKAYMLDNQRSVEADGECQRVWQNYLNGDFHDLRDVRTVEPLIPVLWHQLWPYNAYCPLDDDPELPDSFNGHHQTSCGPTAMAQVLRYWRYPEHGYGYHSYYYQEFDFLAEADFENTYYNWSNMPTFLAFDDPEPVYADIANLMVHSAVLVDGAWESGAGTSDYSQGTVKYLGYSPTCEVLYRDDFTNEEWHEIYRNDLDNGRPIMLSGASEGSVDPWECGITYGHYFICDGYYGDDFYHINWGWGGGGNAYYPLFALGDYILSNFALIGLEPNYDNKKLILNDPYDVDDNTVVLMHFDGNLDNQSNLTNDGVSNGVTSFADNDELGLGQCLYLDNSPQSNQSYLTINDDNDLDLADDWTLEMWFKPISWTSVSVLLNKFVNDNESNYAMEILPPYYCEQNALKCSFTPQQEIERNPANIISETNSIEEGQWYHISFIRNTDLKNLKIVIHDEDRNLIYYKVNPYCNEVAEDPKHSNNPLYIGSKNQYDNFFHGYIDELRISNVVREFEIESTELQLISPNGGESWQSGNTEQIQWSCDNIDNLTIEYSLDNGFTWNTISDEINASLGSYDWLIPEYNSEEAVIKISDTSNDNTYRKNSSNFTIYQQMSLDIVLPGGGECYVSGSTATISWNNFAVESVDFDYSLDCGNTWISVAQSLGSELRSYLWSVPNVETDQCQLRLSDSSNPAVFGINENPFSIVLPDCNVGPYTCDENTIMMFHYENDLINQSSLSEDGSINGNYDFYNDGVPWMGRCLSLDESSYHIIEHNENLSLLDDWTIDMWFNLNAYDAVLINKKTTGWESNYNIHTEAPDGHMEARFYDQNGVRYQISTPAEIVALNQWYHVEFIKNSADNCLILTIRDEDLDVVFNYSLNYDPGTVVATSSNDVYIGENLDGYIDEVRICNSVLDYDNLIETDFGADNYSGVSPLEVNFSDYSEGNPNYWQWDFNNDGEIDSFDQNPTFIFEEAGTYSVQLIAGNGSDSDEEVKIDYIEVTSTDADDDVPLHTQLLGNYPNPFNPNTSFWYNLSEPGDVKIEIFNVKGQHVITLVKEDEKAGCRSVQWNGSDKNGGKTGSGIYFYQMITQGKKYPAKKCLLIQ